MRDITDEIELFREAARHLWNTAFFAGDTDFDARDAFSRVATELFSALVLGPLGAPEQRLAPMWAGDPEHLKRISVIPKSDRISILVNRGTGPNQYWDDPVNVLDRGEAELRLVDFFDWSELARRDFHYVRVRIVTWPAHAHLAGRLALLEFSGVTFLLLEPETQ